MVPSVRMGSIASTQNGHSVINGSNGANGHIDTNKTNGTGDHKDTNTHKEGIDTPPNTQRPFQPVAICGMACRLPGGIHSPSELWSFLHAGRDARGPVPSSRYKISVYHSPDKKPGSVIAQQGYFLDSTNDLAALDTSFFSMPRSEVETLDPQQRLLLEVARGRCRSGRRNGQEHQAVGLWSPGHRAQS